MRVKSPCVRLATALAVTACLFGSGPGLSAFGQDKPASATPRQQPQTMNAAAAPNTLKVTADEAVRMALENNLGVKADRLGPQVETYNVASARAAYGFNFVSQTFTNNSSNRSGNFLSAGTLTSESLRTNGGIQQLVPWGGGRYTVGLDASRRESNDPQDSFAPALNATFSGSYVQPLLRNFRMDQTRQTVLTSQKRQESSDIQLRQQLTQTSRNVRSAYFDLVNAIGAYEVAQQSLELAQTAYKNNQRRVEVGTMAPIDIVQAEAEVASTEEQVIVTEGQIRSAEDRLRVLVMNSSQPDFWTTRLEPAERPSLTPQAIDVEAAIKNALQNRTDLQLARKQIEISDVSQRFLKNQKLPAIDLTGAYSAIGYGGTERLFDRSTGVFPPPIADTNIRSFGQSLRQAFASDFKTWSLTLNISYPIGTSQADASLAANRLQLEQQQTELRDLELGIVAQVRDAARQVATSLKRVETTQKARQLAEQNLQAQEKRLAVGLGDTFQMFQAQRDLTRQRNNELAAIIAYNRALINFDSVQSVPVGGGNF
jgi:outer membrane protein